MDSVFFIGLLSLALVKATPLALGAMCGLMCERSGVINIGIEGMMLMGAMMSFLGSVLFNDLTGGELPQLISLLVGLLVAMLSAGLIALLPIDNGKRMSWPLIPAAAMLLVGLIVGMGENDWARFIMPAAVILLGGYLVLRAFRQKA